MKSIEILRSLFAEEELRKNLQESFINIQRELNDKDYRIAAFYSLDVARIYQLLGELGRLETMLLRKPSMRLGSPYRFQSI